MKLQPLPPSPGVPVDSHAVYSKDTGGAAPSLRTPSLPASLSTFSTFAFFFFLFSFFRPRGPSSLLPSFPMLLVHTRRGRDSFQLVWSLRASVYPLQKAALNLRRNLLRSPPPSAGTFKEEFSSYWRRIFLLALTR